MLQVLRTSNKEKYAYICIDITVRASMAAILKNDMAESLLK